jgi:hypothetical protein
VHGRHVFRAVRLESVPRRRGRSRHGPRAVQLGSVLRRPWAVVCAKTQKGKALASSTCRSGFLSGPFRAWPWFVLGPDWGAGVATTNVLNLKSLCFLLNHSGFGSCLSGTSRPSPGWFVLGRRSSSFVRGSLAVTLGTARRASGFVAFVSVGFVLLVLAGLCPARARAWAWATFFCSWRSKF